jgi:hypothetical protein
VPTVNLNRLNFFVHSTVHIHTYTHIQYSIQSNVRTSVKNMSVCNSDRLPACPTSSLLVCHSACPLTSCRMPVCLPVGQLTTSPSARLHPSLHTFPSVELPPACQSGRLSADLPFRLLVCLTGYFHFRLHACMFLLVCQFASLLFHLPTVAPTCQSAFQPVCLSACLPTCMFVCLYA